MRWWEVRGGAAGPPPCCFSLSKGAGLARHAREVAKELLPPTKRARDRLHNAHRQHCTSPRTSTRTAGSGGIAHSTRKRLSAAAPAPAPSAQRCRRPRELHRSSLAPGSTPCSPSPQFLVRDGVRSVPRHLLFQPARRHPAGALLQEHRRVSGGRGRHGGIFSLARAWQHQPPHTPLRACAACRSREIADNFRTQILNKRDGTSAPVRTLGSCTFMYLRHADIYLLCVTRGNCNVMMAMKFMSSVRTGGGRAWDGAEARGSLTGGAAAAGAGWWAPCLVHDAGECRHAGASCWRLRVAPHLPPDVHLCPLCVCSWWSSSRSTLAQT